MVFGVVKRQKLGHGFLLKLAREAGLVSQSTTAPDRGYSDLRASTDCLPVDQVLPINLLKQYLAMHINFGSIFNSAKMANVGGSLNRLTPEIDEILKTSMVDCCSILIMKDGRPSEGKTFRKVSRDYRVEYDEKGGSLVYAIGSLEKVFIALAMHLVVKGLSDVEENKIWDRPFTDVLNEYSVNGDMKPLQDDPTLKQLLVHYHGVSDGNDLILAPDGSPLLSKEGFIKIIPDVSKRVHGGDGPLVNYSNGNYVLVVVLIEAITRVSFGEYVKTNVLDPLKMSHTFVGPVSSSQTNSDWALPYMIYENGVPQQVENRLSSSDSAASAVMGMHSCAEDLGILYGKFFDALYGNSSIAGLDKHLESRLFGLGQDTGFKSLISEEGSAGYTACGLVAHSNSPYLGFHSLNRLILKNDESTSFILGKGKDFEHAELYCQASSITGYSCWVYLMPTVKEAVVVMTNTLGLNDAADHVSRLILQDLYGLKVRPRGARGFPSLSRKKVNIVALAQRSAEKTLQRWKELRIRDPPNAKSVSEPDKLIGQYRDKSHCRDLIMTKKNDDVFVTLSDGESYKSGEMMIRSLEPRKFRICPHKPAIDVFGDWENLELLDSSPEDAERVTLLSRTVRSKHCMKDEHYIYELVL